MPLKTRRVRAWCELVVSAALLSASVAWPANTPAVAQVSVGATVTVLAAPVEVAVAGAGFVAAQGGETVRPGDRVRTGTAGLGLLTFFDGSETQLTGDVQIELDTASHGYFQTSGTTVNRVRVPQGTGFTSDTPPAAAFVRGTTYVVTVKPLLGLTGPVGSEPSQDDAEAASPEAPALAQLASQAGGQPAPCTRADLTTCLMSAILLADPDGHVGRLGIAPHNGFGPFDLTVACEVGATASFTATATLSPQACAQLQGSVLNLRDVNTAHSTQQQADEIAREIGQNQQAGGSNPPPPGPPPPGGTSQLGPPSTISPPPGPGAPPTGAGGAGGPATSGSGSSAGASQSWSSTVPTRFGIDEGYRAPTAFADSSASWERLVMPWAAIQPNAPNDFTHLGSTLPADELQPGLARGVQLTGLLQFTPGWAQANPEQGQRSPPKNLNLPFDDPNNYFGRFAYETAKFYAGRIDGWIVWNEPEFKPGDAGGGGSFTWLGTDEEFAQLLKVAYLAIKKANPRAVVAFPGTSYWIDQNNHRTQFYERILRILSQDPAAASHNWYHDAVSLNLYRAADDELRVHELYTSIQRRFGISRPVWLTEFNAMPTDDTLVSCRHADDPIQTTMEQQAAYAIQATAMAAAAGFERASFYQMVDDNPCQQPAVWGAVRDDGSRRPVADALRTGFANFTGFTQVRFAPLARADTRWSAWPDDPASYVPNWQVYLIAFDKPGGQRVTVVWNGDATSACVRFRRSGTNARAIDKRGNPLPIQAVDGFWQLVLAPASAHFSGDPEGYYFIGGDPTLVLEDSVDPAIAATAPSTDCN